MMPGMDGVGVCSTLRRDPHLEYAYCVAHGQGAAARFSEDAARWMSDEALRPGSDR